MCSNDGIDLPTGGSKPFNAFKTFKELEASKTPTRLKEIIEKIFSP
jgi:hypothetical protein